MRLTTGTADIDAYLLAVVSRQTDPKDSCAFIDFTFNEIRSFCCKIMFELNSFRISLLVLVMSIASVFYLDLTELNELERQRRGTLPVTFGKF